MFFSVIITLYNKELYIRKCLQSVLSQTHSNFEVVIIDDGSTDNSVKIVNEFNDDRIALHQQSNKGVSVARNVGIEKTSSNYIALIDADDEWLPNHLENLLHLVQMYPDANMWVSGYRKSTKKPNLSKKSIQKIYIEAYLDNRLNNTSIAWTSATLLNKDVFNKTNGFMPRISHGEDQALWLEMCIDGYIAKSFLETAIYNVYDNSLSTKLVASEAEDACILTINKMLDENANISDQIKSKLLEFRHRYALSHAIGALCWQKPSIVKGFLRLSRGTKIYKKRRIIIKALRLVSILFPRTIARFIMLKNKKQKSP